MSSLIRLNIGEPVLFEGQRVVIKDFVLTPNGVEDTKLVCLVYAQRENGNILEATSDRFKPLEDFKYQEFYPSVHLFTLK